MGQDNPMDGDYVEVKKHTDSKPALSMSVGDDALSRAVPTRAPSPFPSVAVTCGAPGLEDHIDDSNEMTLSSSPTVQLEDDNYTMPTLSQLTKSQFLSGAAMVFRPETNAVTHQDTIDNTSHESPGDSKDVEAIIEGYENGYDDGDINAPTDITSGDNKSSPQVFINELDKAEQRGIAAKPPHPVKHVTIPRGIDSARLRNMFSQGASNSIDESKDTNQTQPSSRSWDKGRHGRMPRQDFQPAPHYNGANSEGDARAHAKLMKMRSELDAERKKNKELRKQVEIECQESTEEAVSSMLADLMRARVDALSIQTVAVAKNRELHMREKKIAVLEVFLAEGQKHLFHQLEERGVRNWKDVESEKIHREAAFNCEQELENLKASQKSEAEVLNLRVEELEKREYLYKLLVRKSVEEECRANALSSQEAEEVKAKEFQRGLDAGKAHALGKDNSKSSAADFDRGFHVGKADGLAEGLTLAMSDSVAQQSTSVSQCHHVNTDGYVRGYGKGFDTSEARGRLVAVAEYDRGYNAGKARGISSEDAQKFGEREYDRGFEAGKIQGLEEGKSRSVLSAEARAFAASEYDRGYATAMQLADQAIDVARERGYREGIAASQRPLRPYTTEPGCLMTFLGGSLLKMDDELHPFNVGRRLGQLEAQDRFLATNPNIHRDIANSNIEPKPSPSAAAVSIPAHLRRHATTNRVPPANEPPRQVHQPKIRSDPPLYGRPTGEATFNGSARATGSSPDSPRRGPEIVALTPSQRQQILAEMNRPEARPEASSAAKPASAPASAPPRPPQRPSLAAELRGPVPMYNGQPILANGAAYREQMRAAAELAASPVVQERTSEQKKNDLIDL